MEDKELIKRLSHLKRIKPREDWVVLTRQRIIGEGLQKGRFWDMVERVVGYMGGAMLAKPAFVIPVLACVVAGGAVWQGAFRSLPGDTLYPLRAAFGISAQQSLADLKAVAEQNKVKNLPSAIQEFEANASKISEDFIAIVENQPEKALQASRQVVQLQKEKSEVERILGTKIGEEQEEEIENATRRLVEYEFSYLETRSLTEEQEKLFESAKTSAAEGDYGTALETIWILSQTP